MSGKSTEAMSTTARPADNRPDVSARWAALDSRHERLVTASDAILADSKSDLKAAS